MDWTIFAALFGGAFGAAWVSFFQFLIRRKDDKKDKLDAVASELAGMRKDFEEERTNNARIRILCFSDEVRHGVRHSKESFDQVNLDIDTYHRYCNSHPEYKNNRAVMAIANIESVYAKCLRENDFLE